MRSITSSLFMLCLVFQVTGQVYHNCPVHNQTTQDYENPLLEKWLSAYDVKFYDLQLSVSNTTTEISGSASILMEAVRELDTIVLELQDGLIITEVSLAMDPDDPSYEIISGFEHYDHAIFIPAGSTLESGENFYVRISYEGQAGQATGFFTGITSSKDPEYGFDVTYTLSEPENAKDWFPVKQVLADKIDSVWISITCSDHLMAASNGLLQEIVPGPSDSHTFKWRTKYPMAYYLLSFAVADYRDFSFRASLSGDGDSVLVQNYIYDSDALFTEWEGEIRATGSMITAFSELLMDYPFSDEKYGHAMAPMGGGMEHQTMTTIQDFSFYLVAHELAHQWFGDYLTCGNWQDIWINEGFASYMEYVAAQQIRGQESADGWMSNAMSIALSETKGSVYVPEQSVDDVYRLFDYALTYKKGAILLHMIRYHLNDDSLFFHVLKTYLEAYGMGVARGEDFKGILEAESGIDFSCFFDQWYYGEGYPRFIIQWYQEGDTVKIISEEASSAPEITPFFNTPFDLEIRMSDGSKIRQRFKQEQQTEEFTISVSGLVSELLFDPDDWLLNSAKVIQQIPPNRKFTYGPNPVQDELFIQFINSAYINEIMITTMSGKEVMRNNSVSNPVRMDLSDLADGAYLLVLSDSDQTYKERILKISH